ncbi:MAG: DUF1501 domain-containing protein, partial [Planctomycetota bacterium]
MSSNDQIKFAQRLNRRHFLNGSSRFALGALALGALGNESSASPSSGRLNFHPTAKRVIYLHQSGAPSQFESFDYKPGLKALQGTELPDSIRQGQRLTGMTSGQKSFPIASSMFDFDRHGECGAWVSELLPYTSKIVDDCCIIRSMKTEAINHDPAITFFQTGSQLAGRP